MDLAASFCRAFIELILYDLTIREVDDPVCEGRDVFFVGDNDHRGSRLVELREYLHDLDGGRCVTANMEKLGITDLRKSCYRDLSGGQKQRALIARALCATDKLLILDEPITGLDPASTQDFYTVIRHLNRDEKVAVLMVSHDIGNIVTQANKILQLKQTVQFYGTVEEYKKSEFGREFLGGEN